MADQQPNIKAAKLGLATPLNNLPLSILPRTKQAKGPNLPLQLSLPKGKASH